MFAQPTFQTAGCYFPVGRLWRSRFQCTTDSFGTDDPAERTRGHGIIQTNSGGNDDITVVYCCSTCTIILGQQALKRAEEAEKSYKCQAHRVHQHYVYKAIMPETLPEPRSAGLLDRRQLLLAPTIGQLQELFRRPGGASVSPLQSKWHDNRNSN